MKNKLIPKRKIKKCQEGEILDNQQMYTAGYSDPVTVAASRKLTRKQQMQADEEWREYLKHHPIQIGSEEYNRLPEKAKAQVYKNSITNAIDKAALPTAVAIIAPTALTAGAASLIGSGALTAAADAAGKVGTKISGTNLGKAASTFINNPYVNLGLTGLGAYFVPQHFKNGVDNIKTGNYIGALGDFGMIGLETLGAANTAKLLTNSVKGIVNPLFANPYSPNTLTRVIGTGTVGLDDAVNSGIIRGNPNGGINTTKKPLISKSIITDSKTGELLYTPDEVVNSGDFSKGKQMAVKFFEHPVVQQSYKHNQQLAKRLGITIPDKNPSQIVSQPVKVKYENLGNNTVANVAQSYYGDPEAIISMNYKYYPLNTIRQGIIHENLHRGFYSAPLRPAILDKKYYNTIYKPEYVFWKWKTEKLLKPEYHNSYLADIGAGEAGPNFIDLGRDLGLKIGQKYPGYDKVMDMLNKYNGDKGFMIKQLNDSKAGMRHVWDAMTGKYFTLPLIGGTTYYKLNNLNNEK